MKRRFKESLDAEPVLIIPIKDVDALLRYLKRERLREEKIAENIYNRYLSTHTSTNDYVNPSAEKSRGIAIGLNMAISKLESMKRKRIGSIE